MQSSQILTQWLQENGQQLLPNSIAARDLSLLMMALHRKVGLRCWCWGFMLNLNCTNTFCILHVFWLGLWGYCSTKHYVFPICWKHNYWWEITSLPNLHHAVVGYYSCVPNKTFVYDQLYSLYWHMVVEVQILKWSMIILSNCKTLRMYTPYD